MDLKGSIEEFSEYGVTTISNFFDDVEINYFSRIINSISHELKIDLWKKLDSSLKENDWSELRRRINHQGAIDTMRKHKKFFYLAEKFLGSPVKNFGINKIRINIPSFSASLHPWHQDIWTWPKLRN